MKAIQKNNNKGCISKTVLDRPEELQNLRNDYPLVSEKIKIKERALSNCIKYVLHYWNLQLYLLLVDCKKFIE